MDDATPTTPDRSAHDSGREVQPNHAEHVEESADQADRIGQHRRPAEDDQGIGGNVGREEPYDEEPMAPDASPS